MTHMCFVVCWHTNFMSVGLASRCVRLVWLLLGPMFLIGSGAAPANTLHHSTRGPEGDGDGETATARLESARVATADGLRRPFCLRALLRSCPRLVGPPQSSSCAAGRPSRRPQSRVRRTGLPAPEALSRGFPPRAPPAAAPLAA